jgi:hypothetical protein
MAQKDPMAESHDKAYKTMRGEKPEGRLESVRIEPADGGFVVNCSYRPPKSKSSKGECGPVCGEPHKPKVFESKENLLKFLSEEL